MGATRAGSSTPEGSCRAPVAVPERTSPARPLGDDRVGIVLEDHYWDDSDAAVVFKRFDRWSGDERYVYHGNDGTSFPWNDTAQLDFLDPAVREQVIRTILDVARRFPIIRFDAAMVLAKKHTIPVVARAEPAGHPVARRARHPQARVRCPDAGRVLARGRRSGGGRDPGTLLAEVSAARGLFRPTLGMHRDSSNSAFMHMLRDEARLSAVIKDTIEFDPRSSSATSTS
jgi:hypothetical protein